MKINRIIALLACTMAFTACQDDMQEGSMLQNKIYSLTGKMSGGSTMSRAQIALGDTTSGNGETAYWNKGDEFTLYQRNEDGNWNESVFSIDDSYSETGQNTSATFSTDNPALVDVDYTAFYPTNNVNNTVFSFSIPDCIEFREDQTVEQTWSDYFRSCMVMKANGRFTETEPASVNFHHLMSLARITYTNDTEEDQPISGIYLYEDNSEHMFGLGYSYYLEEGNGGVDCFGEMVNLKLEGMTVPAGESVDLYLLFFPTDIYYGNLEIGIRHDDYTNKYVKLPVSKLIEVSKERRAFEAGKRYWFKVTENSRGLYLSKEYTTDVVTIENPALSSALQEVLERDYGITIELDENNHATLSQMDANLVTRLDLGDGYEKTPISSLEGIEHFKNLTYIWCSMYGIETCDFSQNKALRFVNLNHNNLTSLNLNQNTELTYVSCMGNSNLTSLKIDSCQNLEALEVSGTDLTNESLVVPNKKNLTMLGYGDTALTFNFEEFPSLKEFTCNNLGLPDLDFLPDSTKAQLTYLYCSNNELDTLDLTKYPNLRHFYCQGNKIKVLDITPLDNLTDLNCGHQQDNIRLEVIATETQQETWRNEWSGSWSNQNAFLQGEFSTKEITFTNKQFAAALYEVLGSNKVTFNSEDSTAVILEGHVLLTKELNFADKNLTVSSFEGIEKFKNLEILICNNIGLTTLHVSALTELKELYCSENLLTSLNVSENTSLDFLYCGWNKLTELDVTKNDKLRTLGCHSNDISVLDVSKNVLLESLGCSDNNLTTLNVTNNDKLWTLGCSGNNLSTLDLSANVALQDLYCYGNKLATLDITNNPNLRTLECGGQNEVEKIVVTMTQAQNSIWESSWSTGNNNNGNPIEVIVK